ncbi:MAG: hypothetical protein K0S86_1502 [Geminicoccaceae bacterium]|nr:hypothetical protein [Geminicoccaceae bacterium]
MCRGVGQALGGAEVVRQRAPGPAFRQAARAAAGRRGRRSRQRSVVTRGPVAVPDPFGNVADHVVDAEVVRREGADRRRIEPPIRVLVFNQAT